MSMQIISFITFLSLLVVDLASLKVWQLSRKYISEYSAANIISLHIFLYDKNFRHVSSSPDTSTSHIEAGLKIYLIECSNKDRDCKLDCLFAIYTLKVRSVLANL